MLIFVEKMKILFKSGFFVYIWVVGLDFEIFLESFQALKHFERRIFAATTDSISQESIFIYFPRIS